MKIPIIVIVIVLFAITGCFTRKVEIVYPVSYKKYKGELVSTDITLNIAIQSYVLGCTKNKLIKPLTYEKCLLRAKDYVTNNILFVLDQGKKEINAKLLPFDDAGGKKGDNK